MEDTLYINGTIYTVDENFSRASFLEVRGDSIAGVGSGTGPVEAWRRRGGRIVDLGGKAVIPGLIESHMHFLFLGQTLDRIDIYEKPKGEILELVRAEAERLQPGEWICSMGWNDVLWGEDYPTKEELDAAAPRNPVALARVDAHSYWCNSLALEAAGIDKGRTSPQGGEILRRGDGELWGILIDTAAWLVTKKIPEVSPERRLKRFVLAEEVLLGLGYTGIVDASVTCENLKILKRAYQEGSLKIRSYVMLNAMEDQDLLYIGEGLRPETGLYGGRLSVRAVKLLTDGALGSRSAWLLEDYADRPGHRGNPRWSDQELYGLTERAVRNGFQVGTHAIGDAAVRQLIRVQKKLIDALGLKDHRFRIEHFQMVDQDDFAQAAEAGFFPAMQPMHAAADMKMAELRLGPARLPFCYAWRKILDAGGLIGASSDSPLGDLNPFHGIYAAVTRKNLEGCPPGGWYGENVMTREEALRAYTIWGAYGTFSEKSRGSLEPGKYADYTVLDRDIMTCPEDEIKDTRALMTVIGGEAVFDGDKVVKG